MTNFNKNLLLCTLISTCLVSTEVLALGGIGGGRSVKARNNNGVQAVSAYICVNLDCSKSNIKITAECTKNAYMDHGICYCNDGYIGDGETCQEKTCPTGQKPNSDNSACENCVEGEVCPTCPENTPISDGYQDRKCLCSATSCPEGKYCTLEGTCENDTSCSSCPSGTYCKEGKCFCSGTKKQACGSNGSLVCCDEGSICSINSWDTYAGTCQAKTGDCLTSADCEANQYCSFKTSTENDSTLGYGKCVPLGKETQGQYIYSSETMDWWSARNWCEAHGGEMLPITELSCPSGEESEMATKGFADSGCVLPEGLPDYTHFWAKDIPELTWVDEAETSHYDTSYAFIFSTKFNGVHWLHQKHNFLAKAFCKINED